MSEYAYSDKLINHQDSDETETNSRQPPLRLSSGIKGLDLILAGGLLPGTTTLVAGASGTGKTLLTQQIAFCQAHQGTTVLCLTLLSESHEKMISNLAGFSFFDRELVGRQIHYLSLYSEVESEGLAEFTLASRKAVLKYKARLVIVDGISSLRDFTNSRQEFRKILFDFNVQLSNLGCTVLCLVDDELPAQNAPEYAIADSVIRLHNQRMGKRHLRSLEVLKSRATAALPGLHSFEITSEGLVVYPSLEARLAQSSQKELVPPALQLPRQATGISGLDQMLGGGPLSHSVTLLLGTPGSGKSLIGWRFIYEGARQGEKTLILSLQHSQEEVKAATRQLGYDLSPYLEDGSLQLLWVLPLQRYLDEIAEKLLTLVESHRPSRILIDALSDLENLSLYPQQLNEFWTALMACLRSRQVTTFGTLEYQQIGGTSLVLPERPISVIADNIIILRTVEQEGKLKRVVGVVEARQSQHDNHLRELVVMPGVGPQIGEMVEQAG
jgi:circadian clock protein KaiC